MNTYLPTETSVKTFGPMDARELASGSVALLDYRNRVIEIIPAGPEADSCLEAAGEYLPCCHVCDGAGHAYIVGWEQFTNGTSRPIIGGGPCPLDG